MTGRTPRAIGVTVRTPAGANSAFAIDEDDTASELTDRAVEHFVTHAQLEPGLFRLGLLRDATILDLAPDSRPVDQGAVEGDVFHLLSCEPQVDGMRWPRAQPRS